MNFPLNSVSSLSHAKSWGFLEPIPVTSTPEQENPGHFSSSSENLKLPYIYQAIFEARF